MAELPEIMILSRQMSDELKSKEFDFPDIIQEKCLNMEKDDFKSLITGKKIIEVYNKGKWIFFELTEDYHLLLNLGMGADVLYYRPNEDFKDGYQCHFYFTDDSGFTCNSGGLGVQN